MLRLILLVLLVFFARWLVLRFTRKQCPNCAKRVPRKAHVCHYCQYGFVAREPVIDASASSEKLVVTSLASDAHLNTVKTILSGHKGVFSVLVVLLISGGFWLANRVPEPSDPQEKLVWHEIQFCKENYSKVQCVETAAKIALSTKNKKGMAYLVKNYNLKLSAGAYFWVNRDDLEMVDFLISQQIPISEAKGLIGSFLNHASAKKDVLTLLDYGARPSWDDFVTVMKNNQFDLAQAFISKDAGMTYDGNKDYWPDLLKYANYDTLKLTVEKSFWLIHEGHSRDSKLAIGDLDFNDYFQANQGEFNPVEMAARLGNSDAIRLFVDIGGDVNYLDPLGAGINSGNSGINKGLIYLIEHGAYVSEVHMYDLASLKMRDAITVAVKTCSMKPEDLALASARGGSVEALKYLKKKFGLSYTGAEFSVAAAMSGDTETFKYVAGEGGILNQAASVRLNAYGVSPTVSPAYIASENGYAGILGSLAEHDVRFYASHLWQTIQKNDAESAFVILDHISSGDLNQYSDNAFYELLSMNAYSIVAKMIERGYRVEGKRYLQFCYNHQFTKLANLLKDYGAI